MKYQNWPFVSTLGFGKAIVRTSPIMARMVVRIIPLAPVSGLVAEAFDKIVEHALEEEEEQQHHIKNER